MTDFYAGKVSREELNSYFEECCTSMRTYRTSQHQTSGTNEADQTLRTGSEGEIRNVWDLMEDYYLKSEDTSKVKNFLENISVFTRWYAYETRINDIIGDYEVSHKELR